MAERFRLDCSYLGGRYYGWQHQPGVKTVQALLENALGKLFDLEITVFASGRTDRGVHALNQSVHFDADPADGPPFNRWKQLLNIWLPLDVRVRSITNTDKQFHARHSAQWRVYGYRFTKMKPDRLKPLQRWRFQPGTWHLEAARNAVDILDGSVPTEMFCGSGGSGYEAENWPLTLQLRRLKENEFWLLVAAKSFRYKMVRCLAGTVGACLAGDLSCADLIKQLETGHRTFHPAPASGCFLLAVYYEKDYDSISCFDKSWQRVIEFVDL